MKRFLLLCCLLAQPGLAVAAQLTSDLAAWHLVQRPEVVRWSPVTPRQGFVSGELPVFDVERSHFFVRLQDAPGITVQLDAGSQLRVHRMGAGGAAPRVHVSADGQLFQPAQLIPAGADDWLLADTATVARLVRLSRSPGQDPVPFALFTAGPAARGESLLQPVETLAIHAEPVRLDDGDGRPGMRWYATNPGVRVSAAVQGKRQLHLHVRLPLDLDQLAEWMVDLWADDVYLDTISAITPADGFRVVRVRGAVRPATREETIPVSVPAGTERISFSLTRPAWVQLRADSAQDYLFERNDPWAEVAEPVAVRASGDPVDLPAVAAAWAPWERPQRLRALARDNSLPDAGLQAESLARHWAAWPGTLQAERQLLLTTTANSTHWKTLRPDPASVRGGAPSRPVYLARTTVRHDRVTDRKRAVWRQDARWLRRFLVGLQVSELPVSPEQALLYRLPDRVAPSRLLVAAQSSGATVYVQFDDETPVALLRLPHPAHAVAEELGYLAATQAARPGPESGALAHWLGGGDAADGLRPVWSAAHAELPLPVDVRRIRIWGDASPSDPSAEIGVAIRAGHPHRLDEAGYRSRIARAGGVPIARDLFHAALQALIACSETGHPVRTCLEPLHDAQDLDRGTLLARRQLVNDWLPLLRLLRVRAVHFRRPVRAPFAVPAEGTASDGMDEQPPAHAVQAGPGAAFRNLQFWQAQDQRPGEGSRAVGWLARAEALQSLGESFLAQEILRSLVVYAPPGPVREEAAARLQAELVPGEPFATGLAVTRYLRNPRHADGLLRALLAENEPEYAVKAATALGVPPDTWHLSGLGHAAGAAGWAAPLPPAQVGSREASSPDASVVVPGTMRDLLSALPRADFARQQRLLEDWVRRQARVGGPRAMRNDLGQVSGSAGSEVVEVPERDLSVEMIRATPTRPARYEAVGPGEIEISFRRLNAGPQEWDARQPDWVQVRSGAAVWRIPLQQTQVSDGLGSLSGGENLSSAKRLRWQLPAGFHAFEILPESAEVLIQVHSKLPLWQPDALPRPTPAAIRAALSGPGLLTVLEPAAALQPVILRPRNVSSSAVPVRAAASLAELLPQQGAPTLEVSAVEREAWALLDNLQQKNDAASAAALARLLYAHAGDTSLSGLLGQLRARGWQWQRGGLVLGSAGEGVLAEDDGLPASPGLRSRSLLLPPVNPAVSMLSGDDVLAMEVSGVRKEVIRLQLRARRLPFLQFVPSAVQLEIDGRPLRVVALPNESAQLIRVEIPSGRQALRVIPVDLPPNGFLEVRAELDSEQGWQLLTGQQARTLQFATPREPVRAFLDGPALYRIDRWENGMLRSQFETVPGSGMELTLAPQGETRKAGFAIWRFTREDAAMLSAQAAQKSSLAPAEAQVAALRREQDPVPNEPVPVTPPASADAVELVGTAPLPGLQHGTHAVYVENRVRLELDDEGTGAAGTARIPQQEVGIQHFLRDEEHALFWESAAFVREPGEEDRVLGLRAGYSQDLPFSPWGHGLNVSAHLQNPQGDDEWATALLVRGNLDYRQILAPDSQMRWRLGGFLRSLSLDPGEADGLVIDPIVYSDFKQDHLHGISMHWQWNYLPWRDVRWRAALASHSNEDLNLLQSDRQELVMAWSQVFDTWVAGTEYRLRQFNPDQDRGAFARREKLGFNFERDFWSSSRGRFRVGLNLDRDLFRDLWTGGLRFTWFPQGDDYHHHAPGTIPFEAFRAREIPTELDHEITAPRQ